MKKLSFLSLIIATMTIILACGNQNSPESKNPETNKNNKMSSIQKKIDAYARVELTTDLSKLTENQKKMIPLLIKASKVMNDLYEYQTYGDLDSLMKTIDNEAVREYVKINVGPWDRLRNDEPFVEGVGPKPAGANFYPTDMSKEEFAEADVKDKASLYTFVRRDKDGKLYTIPYNEKFADQLKKAADYLREAAKYAETDGLKKYLQLRADALLTDEFQKSDLAWLEMKDNTVGIVIGPIETYEDHLFGYKASYEAYVLVKDKEWSQRLAKFAAFLPELQHKLPVPEDYKQEKPGSDADLNAYDVIYYAGQANAGGKTIAINLPNDEEVQLMKGTRRLQLKNVMRLKFDKILVPISEILITPEQRKYVSFDAFFANTMFHEVAHGLGIKNTINGKGTVRKALKEHASALEEGKADILGLYMVEQLLQKGELDGGIKEYYVTFIASIFRSVRFGAGDAHGIANMIRFNYFKEQGAFERLEDGTYKINFEKTHDAVESLSRLILTLQGDGAYEKVAELVEQKGKIGEQLQSDLNRLKEAQIPIDIVFDQGMDVLGL